MASIPTAKQNKQTRAKQGAEHAGPALLSCHDDTRAARRVCEVLPRKLYLTNWRGAEDKAQLKAKGVTHVAAVGSEFMCDEEVFVYWKKDIHDDDEMRD